MRDRNQESLTRLRHIKDAILAIQHHSTGQSVESFCANDMLHDAVLFQFSVIGEAIKHVDQDMLAKYNYPWYKVRSFRNMIAHEYFNLKLAAVWQIIVQDLGELERVVREIIAVEFEET